MILQYKIAGFDMERQDRYFAQVPIWFSTGIVVTMLVPLALGITVILEPLYDFELLGSHIRKFGPDYLITATGLLKFLVLEDKASDSYDHFKYLAIGGEYLTSLTEQRFNKWLLENGSADRIHKGYGMCECGGAATSTNSCTNVPGSDRESMLREIASRCSEVLPANHFPHFVRLWERSLPVVPSGKLDTECMKNECSELIELHPMN